MNKQLILASLLYLAAFFGMDTVYAADKDLIAEQVILLTPMDERARTGYINGLKRKAGSSDADAAKYAAVTAAKAQLDTEAYQKEAAEAAKIARGAKTEAEAAAALAKRKVGFGGLRSAAQAVEAGAALTHGVQKVVLDPLVVQKEELEREIARLTAMLVETKTKISSVAGSLGLPVPSGGASGAGGGGAAVVALPVPDVIIAALVKLIGEKEAAGNGMSDITDAELEAICPGLSGWWKESTGMGQPPGFNMKDIKKLKMRPGSSYAAAMEDLKGKLASKVSAASAAVASGGGGAAAVALPAPDVIIAALVKLIGEKEAAGNGMSDITDAELEAICPGLSGWWKESTGMGQSPGFNMKDIKKFKMRPGSSYAAAMEDLKGKLASKVSAASAAAAVSASSVGPEAKLVEDMFNAAECPLYFLGQYFVTERAKIAKLKDDESERVRQNDILDLRVQYALSQLKDIDTMEKVEAFFKIFKLLAKSEIFVDNGRLLKIPLKAKCFNEVLPYSPVPMLLKGNKLKTTQKIEGAPRTLVNLMPVVKKEAVQQAGLMDAIRGGAKLKKVGGADGAPAPKKAAGLSSEELYITIDELMQKMLAPITSLRKPVIGPQWQGTLFSDADVGATVVSSGVCGAALHPFFQKFSSFLEEGNYRLDVNELLKFIDTSPLKFTRDPAINDVMNRTITAFLLGFALLGRGSPAEEGVVYSTAQKDESDAVLKRFIVEVGSAAGITHTDICNAFFTLLQREDFIKSHEVVYSKTAAVQALFRFILYRRNISGTKAFLLEMLRKSVAVGCFEFASAGITDQMIEAFLDRIQEAPAVFPFDLNLGAFLNSCIEKAVTPEALMKSLAVAKDRQYKNAAVVNPILDCIVEYLVNNAEPTWTEFIRFIEAQGVAQSVFSADARKSFEAMIKSANKAGSTVVDPAVIAQQLAASVYNCDALTTILNQVRAQNDTNEAAFRAVNDPIAARNRDKLAENRAKPDHARLPDKDVVLEPEVWRTTLPSTTVIFVEKLAEFHCDPAHEETFVPFISEVVASLKDPTKKSVAMANGVAKLLTEPLKAYSERNCPGKKDLLEKVATLQEMLTTIFPFDEGLFIILQCERIFAYQAGLLHDIIPAGNTWLKKGMGSLMEEYWANIPKASRVSKLGDPAKFVLNVYDYRKLPSGRDELFLCFADFLQFMVPESLLPQHDFMNLCCNGVDLTAKSRVPKNYTRGTADERFLAYVRDDAFMGAGAVLQPPVPPTAISEKMPVHARSYFESLAKVLDRYNQNKCVSRMLLETRIMLNRCMQRLCGLNTREAVQETMRLPSAAQLLSTCADSYEKAKTEGSPGFYSVRQAIIETMKRVLPVLLGYVSLSKEERFVKMVYPDPVVSFFVVAPMEKIDGVQQYINRYIEEEALSVAACDPDIKYFTDVLSLAQEVAAGEDFSSTGRGEFCSAKLQIMSRGVMVDFRRGDDSEAVWRDLLDEVNHCIDAEQVFASIGTYSQQTQEFVAAVKRTLQKMMFDRFQASIAVIESRTSRQCLLYEILDPVGSGTPPPAGGTPASVGAIPSKEMIEAAELIDLDFGTFMTDIKSMNDVSDKVSIPAAMRNRVRRFMNRRETEPWNPAIDDVALGYFPAGERAGEAATRKADRKRIAQQQEVAVDPSTIPALPPIEPVDLTYAAQEETLVSLMQEVGRLPEWFRNVKEHAIDPDKAKNSFLTYPRLVHLVHEVTALYKQKYGQSDQWCRSDGGVVPGQYWLETDGQGFLSKDTLMIFAEKIIVPAGSEIIHIGDLHGSLHAMMRILAQLYAKGLIGQDLRLRHGAMICFSGDLTDRGAYATEVCYIAFLLKLKNPDAVFIAAGNHEDVAQNKVDGFAREFERKFPGKTGVDKPNIIQQLYRFLPIVLYIGVSSADASSTKWIQVCHGGIAKTFKAKRVFLNNAQCKFCAFVGNQSIFNWGDIKLHKGVFGCFARADNPGSFINVKGLLDNKDDYGIELVLRGHQDMVVPISVPVADANKHVDYAVSAPMAYSFCEKLGDVIDLGAAVGSQVPFDNSISIKPSLVKNKLSVGLFDWRDVVGHAALRFQLGQIELPIITCTTATESQHVYETACLHLHLAGEDPSSWQFVPFTIDHIAKIKEFYTSLQASGKRLPDARSLFSKITAHGDGHVDIEYSDVPFTPSFEIVP